MNELSKNIQAFHEKFELAPLPKPGLLPQAMAAFRYKFLMEEMTELRDAILDDDLPGVADALVDLVYVALGTAYLSGLPFDELWAEVQRANMSKVRATSAEQSKRGSAFDVVKPADWKPPQIREVLLAHGWPGPPLPFDE